MKMLLSPKIEIRKPTVQQGQVTLSRGANIDALGVAYITGCAVAPALLTATAWRQDK